MRQRTSKKGATTNGTVTQVLGVKWDKELESPKEKCSRELNSKKVRQSTVDF